MKKLLLGFAFLLIFTMSFSYAHCQEISNKVQVSGQPEAEAGIKSVQWKQISGPGTPAIVSPNANSTLIKDFEVPGTYIYNFTVTDQLDRTATAIVKVSVLPAWAGPVANAQAEYIIRLPAKK